MVKNEDEDSDPECEKPEVTMENLKDPNFRWPTDIAACLRRCDAYCFQGDSELPIFRMGQVL